MSERERFGVLFMKWERESRERERESERERMGALRFYQQDLEVGFLLFCFGTSVKSWRSK